MADEAPQADALAALRPIVGGGEIQVVGALSSYILSQMAWPKDKPSVLLHPDAVHHIFERREADGQLILDNMAVAVSGPTWFGPDPSDPRRIVLVREVEPHVLCVCIAVKLVSSDESHSGENEIWVSTGFPVSIRALTRKRWRDRLQQVVKGTE